MASASLFLHYDDVPVARVCRLPQTPQYDYLVINIGDDCSIFLPHGLASPAMARTLAAELLRVADDFDATQPTVPARDAKAEADCYRVAHTPRVQP